MCQNPRLGHLLDGVIPSTTIDSCKLGIDLRSRLWEPMVTAIVRDFEGGCPLCVSYAWRWVASVALVSTTGLLSRTIWLWPTVGRGGPGDTARSCRAIARVGSFLAQVRRPLAWLVAEAISVSPALCHVAAAAIART